MQHYNYADNPTTVMIFESIFFSKNVFSLFGKGFSSFVTAISNSYNHLVIRVIL